MSERDIKPDCPSCVRTREALRGLYVPLKEILYVADAPKIIEMLRFMPALMDAAAAALRPSPAAPDPVATQAVCADPTCGHAQSEHAGKRNGEAQVGPCWHLPDGPARIYCGCQRFVPSPAPATEGE